MANTDLIKSIRARTSLSFKDIAKAIDSLQTEDEDKIIAHLREQGVLKAQARQDRETKQGGIFSYVHDGKLGVMVEIKCETDFVSRGDSFKNMGNDLALHIAANQPKFVNEDDVDQEFINSEIEIAREQLINQGKPADMLEKILEGKKGSIVKDFSLLSQPFLKDPNIKVSDYIANVSQETGEKIAVTRFVVYSLNS
jgi:elongation factor Ts